MKFRLGELFCGPGGIALGAKQSSFVHNGELFEIAHEWATDYDRDTCKTYEKNITPNRPESVICEDVRNLDLNVLTEIDAFAFGFPCNDFSIVGEQKGFGGHFGPLYTYGVKVIEKFKPKFFIAENVGGLKSNNEGSAFEKIIEELSKQGYDIVANLYKFENYEIPQARHRIIIVGIRNDLELKFRVPVILNPRKVTCREALESPPIPIDAINNEYTKQSHTVIERLKHIKPGENAFNATLPDNLKLNVKGAKISQIYKRLDPNKPSYTVTGSGGGGTHIYHWNENRSLTNRERARLQTFPDDFGFIGSKESVRKQIGMAVPPKAAKIVFEAILKTFAGISYESTESNIQTQNRDLFGKLILEPDVTYLE